MKSLSNLKVLKNMSSKEIKTTYNIVSNHKGNELDGHSIPYLKMVLKRELNYRKERNNAIINALPFLRQKLNEIEYKIK